MKWYHFMCFFIEIRRLGMQHIIGQFAKQQMFEGLDSSVPATA